MGIGPPGGHRAPRQLLGLVEPLALPQEEPCQVVEGIGVRGVELKGTAVGHLGRCRLAAARLGIAQVGPQERRARIVFEQGSR